MIVFNRKDLEEIRSAIFSQIHDARREYKETMRQTMTQARAEEITDNYNERIGTLQDLEEKVSQALVEAAE